MYLSRRSLDVVLALIQDRRADLEMLTPDDLGARYELDLAWDEFAALVDTPACIATRH